MIVVVAMAVMLIGTTAFATDNAFAGKKHYGKSQTIVQAIDCGNGELPLNIGCQNRDSHFDGEDNIVSLVAEQEFPGIGEVAKPIP